MPLFAALVGLGAVLSGCGASPFDLLDSSNSLQRNDGRKCVSEMQGGDTSCKDESTWSAYSAMACAGKNLLLKNVTFSTSCGAGLYRVATYDCCTSLPPGPGPKPPPMPPPPPPRMCLWAPGTGPAACMTADAWKKEGIAFCDSKKLQFNDQKLEKPCGMAGFSAASFQCCTMVPPPPPPPMCTDQTLTEKSCVDDATWKMRAAAACDATKQTLGSLTYGHACMTMAGTGHLDIEFQCCGGVTPPPPMCTDQKLTEKSCVDDGTWKMRAAAACDATKQTLGTLTYGTACMGGHLDIEFQCCGGITPPPPPPPMCTDQKLTEKSCVDDGTWKMRAAAACAASKQTLGTLTYGTACMGGHLDIEFQCCGGITPPPPPPMCTDETQTEKSCVDDATWKTRAEAACKAKMQTLGTLTYGHACMAMAGVGHLDIEFQCCGGITPPPPPACTDYKAPSTGMCESPAQWDTDGTAFCAAKMQTLSGLSLSGPCMGGFSVADYTCCGGAPPPPPPTCTAGVVGDGKSCVAEATLKSQADGICTMAGGKLTAFSAYDTCAMGEYLHAKYECCK